MTVTVKLPDGGIDKYMRYGDSYLEHRDGSLEISRSGAPEHFVYPQGKWTEVEGDQRKHKGPLSRH